jgi:hypothetical protein
MVVIAERLVQREGRGAAAWLSSCALSGRDAGVSITPCNGSMHASHGVFIVIERFDSI